MYRDNLVGVVVPAYNEAGLIGDVIRTMPTFVDHVYVVDDASTDETLEEAADAARESDVMTPAVTIDQRQSVVSDGGSDPLAARAGLYDRIGRVVLLRHEENRGAGGAIKTGYLAAIQDENDVVVTMDGDGQMDPEHMPKLLDPIVDGVADYAKGNRLLYKDYRQAMPKFRFFGNSILTGLTKIASGYWKTMDPQNGYTAISSHALENLGVEGIYEYYGYCNDVLVKLNAKGMDVADVAIPAVYGDEESSINYSAYIWNVSGMLLRNFLWRLKVKYLVLDFHPLALFYILGALTTGLGVAGTFWSFYAAFALGESLFVRASLSAMLVIFGSMFLLFAMLFDMQVNEDREVQVYE